MKSVLVRLLPFCLACLISCAVPPEVGPLGGQGPEPMLSGFEMEVDRIPLRGERISLSIDSLTESGETSFILSGDGDLNNEGSTFQFFFEYSNRGAEEIPVLPLDTIIYQTGPREELHIGVLFVRYVEIINGARQTWQDDLDFSSLRITDIAEDEHFYYFTGQFSARVWDREPFSRSRYIEGEFENAFLPKE